VKKKVMAKMVVLTGGRGFIGSHVCALLVERGYDCIVVLDDGSTGFNRVEEKRPSVYVVDGSICDAAAWRDVSVILNNHVEATASSSTLSMIHLAAAVSVAESMLNAEKYQNQRINVQGSEMALGFAKEWKSTHPNVPMNRFVAASSAACYGDCVDLPLVEKERLSRGVLLSLCQDKVSDGAEHGKGLERWQGTCDCVSVL
jgi:nucleoside-diphosphate-sugar epimerase